MFKATVLEKELKSLQQQLKEKQQNCEELQKENIVLAQKIKSYHGEKKRDVIFDFSNSSISVMSVEYVYNENKNDSYMVGDTPNAEVDISTGRTLISYIVNGTTDVRESYFDTSELQHKKLCDAFIESIAGRSAVN